MVGKLARSSGASWMEKACHFRAMSLASPPSKFAPISVAVGCPWGFDLSFREHLPRCWWEPLVVVHLDVGDTPGFDLSLHVYLLFNFPRRHSLRRPAAAAAAVVAASCPSRGPRPVLAQGRRRHRPRCRRGSAPQFRGRRRRAGSPSPRAGCRRGGVSVVYCCCCFLLLLFLYGQGVELSVSLEAWQRLEMGRCPAPPSSPTRC